MVQYFIGVVTLFALVLVGLGLLRQHCLRSGDCAPIVMDMIDFAYAGYKLFDTVEETIEDGVDDVIDDLHTDTDDSPLEVAIQAVPTLAPLGQRLSDQFIHFVNSGPNAFVRPCPGTNCGDLGALIASTTVEAIGFVDGQTVNGSSHWYHISSFLGEGYIHCSRISVRDFDSNVIHDGCET